MSAIITERDAKRLGSIAARLASDQAGERAAAALIASRELHARGLDWQTVIARAIAPGQKPARSLPRQPAPFDMPAKVRWLRACSAYLTPWEQRFVVSVAEQLRPLSTAQIGKLIQIAASVELRCGGEAEP